MPSRPEDLGSTISYSYNLGDYTYQYDPAVYSSSTTMPVMIPAMLPFRIEEKKDDSPFAWLREQVDEICELAFAA